MYYDNGYPYCRLNCKKVMVIIVGMKITLLKADVLFYNNNDNISEVKYNKYDDKHLIFVVLMAAVKV